MTREGLAVEIYNRSHITGEFVLRSGAVSNEYFDKYLFESAPSVLKQIGEKMSELVPKDTELLAGLELGGVAIAAAISMHTGIPQIFVRKKAKEYGTCKIVEGVEFSGKKVCVIEDIVTSGGAQLDGTNILRDGGALVDTVLCVILRNEAARQTLADKNLTLHPLYTMDEIKTFAGI